MRDSELHRTTKRFHGMDGRSRRQARNDACLGRIGTYSQTYTTYVWTPPTMGMSCGAAILIGTVEGPGNGKMNLSQISPLRTLYR